MFEFASPAFGIAGVAGAICLLLGLFALQLLPINYAGLALILVGMAMMAAEVVSPSFGALGVGGVTAFVAGGIMLFDEDMPGFGIPLGADHRPGRTVAARHRGRRRHGVARTTAAGRHRTRRA